MDLLMDNLDGANPKNFIVAMLLKRTGCKKKKPVMNPGLFDISNRGLGKRRRKPKPKIVLLPARIRAEAKASADEWIQQYRACYRTFINRRIVAHSLGQGEASKDPRIEKIFQQLKAQKRKWWAMQREKKNAKHKKNVSGAKAQGVKRKKGGNLPNTSGPKRPKLVVSAEGRKILALLDKIENLVVKIFKKGLKDGFGLKSGAKSLDVVSNLLKTIERLKRIIRSALSFDSRFFPGAFKLYVKIALLTAPIVNGDAIKLQSGGTSIGGSLIFNPNSNKDIIELKDLIDELDAIFTPKPKKKKGKKP